MRKIEPLIEVTPEALADRYNKKLLSNIRSVYNKKTDRNDHTGAALLLVMAFGTEDEKEEMKAIQERHNERGYIEEPDYSRRYVISQKYYKMLSKMR